MARKIFYRWMAVILSAALVWTSGSAAEAVLLLRTPGEIFAGPRLDFLRNEERVRLETQALSEQYASSRALLNKETFPFLSHLVDSSKIYVGRTRALEPFHPYLPAWFTRLDAAALAIFIPLLVLRVVAGFFTGQGQYELACGNFIMFGALALLQIMHAMKEPARDLVNRGVLSAGMYFLVQAETAVPKEMQIPGFEIGDQKTRAWIYEGDKQVILKRDDAVEVTFEGVIEKAEKATAAAILPLSPASVELHSRFSTTGDDNSTLEKLRKAAQPGIAPGHWSLTWEPVSPHSAELEPRYVWVEHHHQFNGDLNETVRLQLQMSEQDKLGNQKLLEQMMRWLKPGEMPPGDAPLLALLLEIFYTERDWHASMRYALFAHVSAPGDHWDQNPPLGKLASWDPFFNQAFKVFQGRYPELAKMPAQKLKSQQEAQLAQKHMARQAEALKVFMIQLLTATPLSSERQAFLSQAGSSVSNEMIDDIRLTLGSNLNTFLTEGTKAFWRNSLDYAAIREIKTRIRGTFGGTSLSSRNPPGSRVMSVTTSLGQGIVAGFNDDGTIGTITSDRLLQQQMVGPDGKDIIKDILVLDDSGNETLVTGMGPDGKIRITLYRGPNSVLVTEDELRRARPGEADPRPRIRPLRDPEEPEPRNSNGHLARLPRLESGVRDSSVQLGVVHRGWEDVQQGVNGRNMQTSAEINRVLIQQKIYGYIVSRIGVKRDLSEDLEEQLWSEAERLSRASWDLTADEKKTKEDSEEVAARFTQRLIASAPLKADPQTIGALLSHIAKIASDAVVGELEKQINALREITGFGAGALDLGAGTAADDQPYDVVLIGTEKSKLALDKFGSYILGPMLGLRVKLVSGNDFLEMADKYRNNPAGFMRAMRINSMRTLLLQASDSAETFEAGVDSAWAVATVRELFTVTGGKDNRLVDRVKRFRSIHTHNPGSKVHDNLSSYISMLQTFNELGLFLGENTTRRFKTGETHWQKAPFFRTPFKHSQFQILERSNDRFVNEIAPGILGYTSAGHEIKIEGTDREKLEAFANYLTTRQLEMLRLRKLELVHVALTPVFGGAIVLMLYFLAPFSNSPLLTQSVGIGILWAGVNALIHASVFITSNVAYLTVFGLVSGFGLNLMLLLGMRLLRRWKKWPSPKLLAGFSAPSIVIADSHRYACEFLVDYARIGFGKAFGINSATYYDTLVNDLIDRFKALANRRAIVWIGRPGTQHPILRTADKSAETAGRQLKSILNLMFRWMEMFGFRPISPEVVYSGSYIPADNRWWRMSRDRDVDFAHNNVLWTPPGGKLEEMPDHLAEYYENNYGAFGRLLGGARVLATHIHHTATVYPNFPEGTYQGEYDVKSTGGPVQGDRVAEAVQSMAPELVAIIDPTAPTPPDSNSAVSIAAFPVEAYWTPDIVVPGNGNTHSKPKRTRTVTVLPGRASSVAPLAGQVPPAVREPKPEPRAEDDSASVTQSRNRGIPAPVVNPELLARTRRLLRTKNLGSRDSSLIFKRQGFIGTSTLEGAFQFDALGHIVETTDTLPDHTKRLLERALQMSGLPTALKEAGDARNGIFHVARVTHRAAFHTRYSKEDDPEIGSVTTFDSDLLAHILAEIEKHQSAGGVGDPAAELAGAFEIAEELLHLTLLIAEPDRELADREIMTQGQKIELFLDLPGVVRQAVIDFWKTYPNSDFDPKEWNYSEEIYGRAHQAYSKAGPRVKRAARLRKAKEAIVAPLAVYVTRALTQPFPTVLESPEESIKAPAVPAVQVTVRAPRSRWHRARSGLRQFAHRPKRPAFPLRALTIRPLAALLAQGAHRLPARLAIASILTGVAGSLKRVTPSLRLFTILTTALALVFSTGDGRRRISKGDLFAAPAQTPVLDSANALIKPLSQAAPSPAVAPAEIAGRSANSIRAPERAASGSKRGTEKPAEPPASNPGASVLRGKSMERANGRYPAARGKAPVSPLVGVVNKLEALDSKAQTAGGAALAEAITSLHDVLAQGDANEVATVAVSLRKIRIAIRALQDAGPDGQKTVKLLNDAADLLGKPKAKFGIRRLSMIAMKRSA